MTVVSLVPLVGLVVLALNEERLQAVLIYLVSFAAGALLAGAFVHLIPEAAARLGPGLALSAWLLAGFLGFFLLEKFVWAHSHAVRPRAGAARPAAVLYLVGDAVHNLIDGMVIAAAYLAEPALGLATTVAVVGHEVPEEIGAYGILLHGGFGVRRAILFNVLSGATAIVGALAVLIVGTRLVSVSVALLPLAAGNFLYIAAADLVPELQRVRSRSTSAWQVAVLALGVAVVSLAALLVE